MSMWGSLFIEYDFSKGQEKVFSIPFFPLVILFFWKNQLFLYWSLKIGFPLSIILITLISWSFSSTFMGNLSSVFFTSLIWFFCSISLSSPLCGYLNTFWLLIIIVLQPFSFPLVFFSLGLFSCYRFLLLFHEIRVSLNSLKPCSSPGTLGYCSEVVLQTSLSDFTLCFETRSVWMISWQLTGYVECSGLHLLSTWVMGSQISF